MHLHFNLQPSTRQEPHSRRPLGGQETTRTAQRLPWRKWCVLLCETRYAVMLSEYDRVQGWRRIEAQGGSGR